jgi:hypothetical protein
LAITEVTELRLSVPEAGSRLLPLPIAAWLIQRLVPQVAEATGRTVEEVFEAETAAALHEQIVAERINEVLNQDDED